MICLQKIKTHTFIFTLLALFFLSIPDKSYGQKTNAKIKDSCSFELKNYFSPNCLIDTCRGGPWIKINGYKIKSMKVVIHDPENKKIIFSGDYLWDGKLPGKECYCKTGLYPYSITVTTEDGRSIKNSGKINVVLAFSNDGTPTCP